MRRWLLGCSAIVLLAGQAQATTFYVSNSGSDGNTGTTPSTAFATISHAHDAMQPGDKIDLLTGVYEQPAGSQYVATFTKGGSEGAFNTIEAAPCAHPVIHVQNDAVAGLQINASYWIVQGIEFAGDQAKITPGQTSNAAGAMANYDGPGASPQSHIYFLGNTAHDLPGSGFNAINADYVVMGGNTVFNNAYYGTYGGSGLNIFESHDVDGSNANKNFIVANVVYGNDQKVNSTAIGIDSKTDGNGIIVDTNWHFSYQGGTVVALNVAYNNGATSGGRGIEAFQSNNVVMQDNDAWGNGSNYSDVSTNNVSMQADASDPNITGLPTPTSSDTSVQGLSDVVNMISGYTTARQSCFNDATAQAVTAATTSAAKSAVSNLTFTGSASTSPQATTVPVPAAADATSTAQTTPWTPTVQHQWYQAGATGATTTADPSPSVSSAPASASSALVGGGSTMAATAPASGADPDQAAGDDPNQADQVHHRWHHHHGDRRQAWR